jgi:hypothetical protein
MKCIPRNEIAACVLFERSNSRAAREEGVECEGVKEGATFCLVGTLSKACFSACTCQSVSLCWKDSQKSVLRTVRWWKGRKRLCGLLFSPAWISIASLRVTCLCPAVKFFIRVWKWEEEPESVNGWLVDLRRSAFMGLHSQPKQWLKQNKVKWVPRGLMLGESV